MVLRFWNRTDLLNAGVEGISNWMDQWYEEDPDRLVSWELWKKDAGDNGSRSPSEVPAVPLGAGFDYLKRVKSGVRSGLFKPGQKKSGGCLSQIIAMCVLLFVLIISLQ